MAEYSWNGLVYDDSQFEVLQDNNVEYLHYAGGGTDLRDMKLPVGITSTHMMFAGTDVEYGPAVLPEGIEDVSYMYADAQHLREGSVVPDTVTNQMGQYDGCVAVTDVKNFSNNAKDITAFAANCLALERVPEIPDSVTDAESAFEACESLSEVYGGKNVKNAIGIYAGCSSLVRPAVEMNPEADLSDAFTGCRTLFEKYPEIVGSAGQELSQKLKMSEQFRQAESASTKFDREAATNALTDGIKTSEHESEGIGIPER